MALIKLLPKKKGKPFPFAELGDSDKVRIGDWSLAMGNPVLAGDGLHADRDLRPHQRRASLPAARGKGLLEYTDCIQIDTSINPGNSGGPLFNMKGELIGINGRGSFEKRGRVNSGVGYAISINQIKNFLGHLHAGIDTDHATLGAAVGTASEDAPLAQMVVKQCSRSPTPSAAASRKATNSCSFAGRRRHQHEPVQEHPRHLPEGLAVAGDVPPRTTERHEMLVRLMGNMATEKEQAQCPAARRLPQTARPKDPPRPPKGSGSGEAAKMYMAKKGYANWYFNELERDRASRRVQEARRLLALGGTWIAEGKYVKGDRTWQCPLRSQRTARTVPIQS